MSTEDFVKGFFQLKQELLASYFEPQHDKTMVADMIRQLNLAPNDSVTLYNVLDAAITDTMYTILLGLDGEHPSETVKKCTNFIVRKGRRLQAQATLRVMLMSTFITQGVNIK
ncbi:hypothetical protein GK091_25350 [Spirosoma agri]|uniref:Uncharacterized protein n=1 Tax=Spirosoma agri TaxID=1987381 RepID=A0A6M0IPH0_9BACT|nr:hypothetical protein [Spirosoma agri]NEU70229.1 hypothetical protein [Spirosoma agri]